MRKPGGSAIIRRVETTPLGRPGALALALLLLAATQAACVTRSSNQLAFEREYTKVTLRAEKRGFSTVPKGYEHPSFIAEVRVAHILSRIDMRREEDKERVPAIPLETLYLIAEGVSKALSEASPDQAVAVQSIRRDKKWGLFERQYLTSLLVYQKQGLLYVQISRSDWLIPRDRMTADTKLPQTHPGKHPRKFRLVVDKGMALYDHQTAAVDWRNEVFKKPTRTRVTPSGKVVRRTILMESLEDDTDYGPVLSGDLTPEQLRALADLEESRRKGAISESEYTTQRTAILRGETPQP